MTLPANGLCTLNGVTSVPVIPLGHFVAFSVRINLCVDGDLSGRAVQLDRTLDRVQFRLQCCAPDRLGVPDHRRLVDPLVRWRRQCGTGAWLCLRPRACIAVVPAGNAGGRSTTLSAHPYGTLAARRYRRAFF